MRRPTRCGGGARWTVSALPRRVEAHRARARKAPGRAAGAGGAVVARHDQGRPLGLGVEQRGEQVGAQARRDERALGLAARGIGERGGLGVSWAYFRSGLSMRSGRPGARAA